MHIDQIKNVIRNVPAFPKTGIQYKDISTLLQDPKLFEGTINTFFHAFKDKKIVDGFQGVLPKNKIIEFIEKNLGENLGENFSSFFDQINELLELLTSIILY